MRTQDLKVLDELHPVLRPAVEEILKHINSPGKLPEGWELRAQCGYRTPAAQLLAYRNGTTKLKKSPHNYKPARACDLVWWHPKIGWSWARCRPWWLTIYWGEAAGGLTAGGRWGTPAEERKIAAHSGMRIGWDPGHVQLKSWWASLIRK